MKKPRKKPGKAKAQELFFDRNYLSTVEETLHLLSIGVGATKKHRQKYIDLLVQSMKDVASENTTLH